jgi:hypothetical protein
VDDDRVTDVRSHESRHGVDGVVILTELDVPGFRAARSRELDGVVVQPQDEHLGLDRTLDVEVVDGTARHVSYLKT